MHAVAQLLRKQIGEIRTAHRPGQQAVAIAVHEVGKIARSVGVRWHADFARIDTLRLARALIVRKEENLVAANRAADVSRQTGSV